MLPWKVTKVLPRICRHRYADTEIELLLIRSMLATAVGVFSLALAISPSSLVAQAEAKDWHFGVTGHSLLGEMSRRCPGKHLDLLSPDDMYSATEVFRSSLPHGQMRLVDAGAGFDRKLGGPIACRAMNGLNCDANHYLDGIRKAGLMPRFVSHLCASYVVCVSQSNCTDSPPAPRPSR